jgi:hypothetical protein
MTDFGAGSALRRLVARCLHVTLPTGDALRRSARALQQQNASLTLSLGSE